MPKIQKCRYVDNYQLEIVFDNGIIGSVNLENEVVHEPYTSLQDITIFKRFYLDHGAICWSNGKIDMSVEYLFFLANKANPELQALFKEWGSLLATATIADASIIYFI